MDPFGVLAQRIQDKLADAEAKRQLYTRHLQERMNEIDRFYRRFNELAIEVVREHLEPRMKLLIEYFDNSKLVPTERPNSHVCECLFRRTQRYPATTTLTLGVHGDEQERSVFVSYKLQIRPIFIKFKDSDHIDFPIEDVDATRLSEWLDERLLEFIDTYQLLESTEYYQRENLVVDPVCGMEITKGMAAAKYDHDGKTHYFCIQACYDEFVKTHSRSHDGIQPPPSEHARDSETGCQPTQLE